MEADGEKIGRRFGTQILQVARMENAASNYHNCMHVTYIISLPYYIELTSRAPVWFIFYFFFLNTFLLSITTSPFLPCFCPFDTQRMDSSRVHTLFRASFTIRCRCNNFLPAKASDTTYTSKELPHLRYTMIHTQVAGR